MSTDQQTIKIGTRGSPLAMTQTHTVRDALLKAHPGLKIEIVEILTSGDWKPSDGETRLSTADGGKGQFAKEIEEALLDGRIDAAVHSMKDMETFLPEGLEIRHMLPREDAHDVLLFRDRSAGYASLADLPENCRIGTASVRRQAFLLAKRPDLKVEPIRGNVQTRIQKLRDGQVDVTLLALAGLKRLGLEGEVDLVLSPDEMLPAAGQGAVGVEIRSNDNNIMAIFNQINCTQTYWRVCAERAMLSVLDGSCHTPIGAHAVLNGEEMTLRGAVAALDGSEIFEDALSGAVHDEHSARDLGLALGENLKARVPAGFLAQAIKEAS